MAKKDDIGYVYIFTNESFREGWVKIGKTKDVKKRLTQLDNTSCPYPFDVYATLKTSRYDDAEEFVHDFISHFNQSLRIRPNREYFKVDPEEALDILYKVKKLMNEPGAEIVVYDEKGKKHMKQLEKKHGCSESAPENIETEAKPDNVRTSEASKDTNVWMISANAKFFDHRACFKEQGCIYWKQNKNMHPGDIGYIYYSKPYQRIVFKFEVLETELPYGPEMEIDKKYHKTATGFEESKAHNRYYKMRMIGESVSGKLSLPNLQQHGLKQAPLGAMKLSNEDFKELREFIEENF